jgi:hypothetical protein
MGEDRHRDRHGNRPRIPADLWVSLGETAGDRERTKVVVALVRWYLGLGPAPARPAAARKADKTGKTT